MADKEKPGAKRHTPESATPLFYNPEAYTEELTQGFISEYINAYIARRLIGNRFLVHIAILFTTTPFFLQQTYFTWSKNLALAFALLLFYYRKSQSKFLTSILIFLGFFAHPMFLIYMVALLGFGWVIYLILKFLKITT